MQAMAHWNAMEQFRADRRRCKNYTYGRQWDDTVHVEGRSMKEEDYIRSQGNIPLKNNLIRRIVRNVVGVFRNQYAPPSAHDLGFADNPCADEFLEALAEVSRRNELEELFARTMEEFLISGMAVHRKWFGHRGLAHGCWTDYVNPDYFFIDTDMRDFRGWDASILGEIHDVSFGELCAKMAKNSDEIEYLSQIYPEAAAGVSLPNVGKAMAHALPCVGIKCRVIEVWIKVPAVIKIGNLQTIEQRWHYYFLSPEADVLAEGDSPYSHGSHPYVFKAYPFIDGEIHSFVADLIDQQRYINRLVTLYDWIMRASAKGVLLFPESALPDGVDIDEISSEWSRFNGVILFRPRAGVPLPQQISGNATNIGITELLNVQLKMMEDVSGVNGALQGKLESGNISGTLYDQQTRHALTGLLDILQSFGTFIRDSFSKDLAMISSGK